MNENARKWVEALRSGEYEQARGALRHDKRFCCLGVACDLYANETDIGLWTVREASYHFTVDGNGNDAVLPGPVRKWLGLSRPTGSFACGTDSLASHNDQGETFEQIADLIESEPDGLFEAKS